MKISGEDGKCPACDEIEMNLHHLYCQNEETASERTKQLSIFSKAMKKCHTYPGIISIAQQLLSVNDDNIEATCQTPSTYIDIQDNK